jgi:5-formyltetrahydrofolate cyclo-ligase
MSSKIELRLELKKRRAALSSERRKEASLALFHTFSSFSGPILSFESFSSEINLSPLNNLLAKEQRLLLPKISGEDLLVSGNLSEVKTILVPGLGFDGANYRIGYGKGYYDRFLHKIRESGHPAKFIGVGFREQFCLNPLPTESYDIPVDEILLF